MTNDPILAAAAAASTAHDEVRRLAPEAAHDERATARLAQAALFEEALLDAVRAHVAELRTVAK